MRAYNSILGVEIFLWIFDIMRTKKNTNLYGFWENCTDFEMLPDFFYTK